MFGIIVAIALLGASYYAAIGNPEYMDVTVYGTVHHQPIAIVLICAITVGFAAGILSMVGILVARSVRVAKLQRLVHDYEIQTAADKDVIYRAPGLGQEGDNVI